MKHNIIIFIAAFLVMIFGYFIFSQSVVPATTSTQNSFTLAEVALHNSESNCWTVVKGKVYNLTSMISNHPSGKSDILRICGINGTNLFQNQHGNKAKVIRQLNSGLLGNLK